MLYSQNRGVYSAPHWKRGRAVEGTGLENRRPERVLEFESLRFRQIRKGLVERQALFALCRLHKHSFITLCIPLHLIAAPRELLNHP